MRYASSLLIAGLFFAIRLTCIACVRYVVVMTTTTKTETETTRIACGAYDCIEWALLAAKRGNIRRTFALLATAEKAVRDYQNAANDRYDYRGVAQLGHVHVELGRAVRECTELLYADGWTRPNSAAVHASEAARLVG